MGKRLHYKDLVGKRFDHLVVEELSSEVIYKDGYPVRLWKCKCDCGAVTYKQTATLNRNKHNSCGECTFKYRMTKLHNSAGYIDGTEISKIRNVKTTSRNRSGVRGVYFDKGKWRARLRFKGKMYDFGSHDTIEEAAFARREGEREIYGSFLEAHA